MGLRVHELAKELKISTAALKKHLKDMGVVVKSHMSIIEEDVSSKIRAKFREQVKALKQIETSRKMFYERNKQAREHKTIDKKSVHKPRPYVETKTDDNSNSHKFVEKNIKKTTENKPVEPVSHQQSKDSISQSSYNSNSVKIKTTENGESRENIQKEQQTGNNKPNSINKQSHQTAKEGHSPKKFVNKPKTQDNNSSSENKNYKQNNQGSRPEYRNSQRTRTDNKNTQGNRPDYRNSQGTRTDNRNAQGYRPNYQNSQGTRTDNRNAQGNRPNYQNSQGTRTDNRNAQGNRPNYQNSQGTRTDNRNAQGYRPDYRNSQGTRTDNRNAQGYRPDYRNSQGTRTDNRNAQGNRPNYQNSQGTRTDNRNQFNKYSNDNRPRYNSNSSERRPYNSTARPAGNFQRNSSDSSSKSFGRKPVNSFRPKPTTLIKSTEKPFEGRNLEKKKVTSKYEQQNKHLSAKLKFMKKGKGKKKHLIPTEIEQAEITKNIKATLSSSNKKKKYKKEEKQTVAIDTKIVISEFTSVSELAKLMGIQATDIIGKFFGLGQMVTINQRLDKDSLEMICSEFNFDVTFQEEYGTEILEENKEQFANIEEIDRPPIVTIMGHVDHGKTSILDHIRSTNVIAGEAGGITQHIGAYQVEINEKKITFLDTPGHEAFTAMRARGANITDVAIIVVAANDGVMPQTKEAIDHAKAADVSLIVAINKIDLPEANVERTIANLAEQNVYLEGYGGEVLWTQTSAKTGEGIDDLLELVLLAAEMKELKAKKDIPGKGVVIEAKIDSRKGVITTILLQEGTMKKGDSIVCGATYGKIRQLENERFVKIKELYPSEVAIVYGLSQVPKAGDIINCVKDDKIARSISSERQLIRHEREKFLSGTNLANLFDKIKEDQMTDLNLIVKCDTDGSVEALCDSFQKLSNDEVKVNIIHRSVGGIIEADVHLATASNAVIVGFHVRANNQARKLAEDSHIEIKLYSIIYDAIQDVKLAINGLLKPEFEEKYLGTAEVKQLFKVKKIGTIAGCAVVKGNITRTALIRLYRNNLVVHEGKVSSLKHYSEEVDLVKAGTECGIGIEDFNDIKENDIIEAFQMAEKKREI